MFVCKGRIILEKKFFYHHISEENASTPNDAKMIPQGHIYSVSLLYNK